MYEKALKLAQESKNFIDEASDLSKISSIINGAPISLGAIKRFDAELRNKYPEINIINNLANSIRWRNVNPMVSGYGVSSQEIESMKFDRFCILARILKSAGEIDNYIDFFDNYYIDN